MNEVMGNIGLALALFFACATMVASLVAGRFELAGALRVAKGGVCAIAGALTLGSIALLTALVDSDFTVRYVAHYTERALPMGYKLAAFWAGQAGSLLLWAWMLAAMSVLTVFTHRPRSVRSGAMVIGILALVCGFFAALMAFAPDANPFSPSEVVLEDGQGLNPMLQDPGMIAHPPLLFMGYAGCTIPFALLAGALIASRKIETSFAEIRNWTVFSWLLLTVGILLGAQWAYVELGWGGYWAWDPVENASLLPWLTATALLHSIMVQQHRGMLKIWNAVLVSITFILCIFGTYLTRSGVVQSVHAFEASLVGTFFLVFLILITVGSVVLIALRLRGLKSERPLENLLGREGAFLIVCILLSIMMLVTLAGTISPLLSGFLAKVGAHLPLVGRLLPHEGFSVGQPFYNTWVVPLGLVLVALMACAPLLVYGAGAGARLRRGLLVPGVVAVVTAVAMFLLGLRSHWALLCGAIIAAGVTTTLLDLFRAILERIRAGSENALVATLRLLDSNHRRYGGQLAHVGMLMLVAGVAGSSLYSVNQTFQMTPGQTVKLGRYDLTYKSIEEVKGQNYTAVQVTLDLNDGSGQTRTLRPQRRFYKDDQPNAEVAIRYGLREDLYASLAGWDDDGQQVAVQAIINPLINWIWLGGIVMSLGGIICLLPRLSAVEEVVATGVAAKKKDNQKALAR